MIWSERKPDPAPEAFDARGLPEGHSISVVRSLHDERYVWAVNLDWSVSNSDYDITEPEHDCVLHASGYVRSVEEGRIAGEKAYHFLVPVLEGYRKLAEEKKP